MIGGAGTEEKKIKIRVERSRKKLLEASKNGDKEARRKVKNKKKTDALRSSKYRNLKREKTWVLVKDQKRHERYVIKVAPMLSSK